MEAGVALNGPGRALRSTPISFGLATDHPPESPPCPSSSPAPAGTNSRSGTRPSASGPGAPPGHELVVPKGPGDLDNPEFLAASRVNAPTSGKAIASLVLGLTSFFCFFRHRPAGDHLGAIELSDIGKSYDRIGGKGLAIAGIVLGSLGTFFTVFLGPVRRAAAARRPVRPRGGPAEPQCINNLKQVAIAFHDAEAATGHFPPPPSATPRQAPAELAGGHPPLHRAGSG